MAISSQQAFAQCPVDDPTLSVYTYNVTDVTCPGDSDGVIEITLDGIDPGLTWSDVRLFRHLGGGSFSFLGSVASVGNVITFTSADLTFGNIIEGEYVVQIQGENGCSTVLLGAGFSFDLIVGRQNEIPTAFNVTNSDPTNLCSTDDLSVALDGSEVGVTYEVFLDGVGSGITAAGTGAALNISVSSGSYADGQVVTVRGDNGICAAQDMTGSFTLAVDDSPNTGLTVTSSSTDVCSGDPVTISVASTESGYSYQLRDLTNAVDVGVAQNGTGGTLNFNTGAIASTTEFGIVVTNGSCTVQLTDTEIITTNTIVTQTVTTTDQAVCETDNFTTSLANSQTGVTYELLANGGATGITAAGTGAALNITTAAAGFANGDVITVQASNGGICPDELMTGSYTLTIDATPNIGLTVTASANTICEGDAVTISVASSEVGVTYQLRNLTSATNIGATQIGDGSTLDFASGAITTTSEFAIMATNGACTAVQLTDTEVINVDANPDTSLPLTASSNNICDGDAVTISLANSESGVTYQLRDLTNAVDVGATQAGTGGTLNFPTGAINGDTEFALLATNGTCPTAQLTDTEVITTNTIDVQNLTTGNTTVCDTDNFSVDLDNSQIGVTYEVMANGIGSGVTTAGTGAALSISVAAAGFTNGDVITVEATNGGVCPAETMTGNFTLTINASPSAALIVNASSNNICEGDVVTISVLGSESGVTYQLRDLTNAIDVGATQAGTGGTLNFSTGAVNATTEFGIVATSGVCPPVQLTDTETITTNTIDNQNVTTGNTTVCSSENFTVDLDGSQVGITYELLANGVGSGITAAGTGAALAITTAASGFTDGDVITVQGTNGGVCPPTLMTGSFTLSIDDAPSASLTVSASSNNICDGDAVTISVASAEVGVSYQLRDLTNAIDVGAPQVGAGVTLDFATGAISGTTEFAIVATNGVCPPVQLTDTETITTNTIIVQNLTTGNTTVCETDNFNVDLDGSQVGVTYEILANGVGTGITAAGTGGALGFTPAASGFTDGDVITVEATNGGICAAEVMTGNFTLTIDVAPSAALTVTASANTICEGDAVTISVASSEVGVSYQLRDLTNALDVGAPQVGTGATLDFASGVINSTTEFGIVATNGTCPPVQLTDTETITTVAPPNTGLAVTASSNDICDGDAVTISVATSEVGVNYQLRDLTNAVDIGAPQAGTGATLDFASGAISGTTEFGVVADNGTCAPVQLTQTQTITTNTIDVHNLTTGNTTVCDTDNFSVDLDNSQVGVTYEIMANGVGSGITAAGTGAALNILAAAAGFTDGDVITVEATNGGICPAATMTGNFTLSIDASPNTGLAVTASSNNICDGDAVTISVATAEVGVSYQLRDLTNAVDVGAPQVGAGATLDFATGAISGTTEFGVVATNGTCAPVQLTQTQTITTNTIATQNVTTTDQTVCETDNFTVDLDGSELGVTYELLANGVGSGVTAAGTGAALSITTAASGFADGDVITVEATNGGICPAVTMTGGFTLNIDAAPNTGLTVTASTNTVCEGDAVTISLTAGEAGVSYQLRDLTNALDVGAPQVGDGATTLDFATGAINSTTEFAIVATNGTCAAAQLADTETITTVAPPNAGLTVSASSNDICDGDAVTISVASSEVGVNYQLRDLTNAVDIGAPQAGTGATLDFASGAISGTTEFGVVADNGTCAPVQLTQTQTITTNTIDNHNLTTGNTTVCDTDNFSVDLDNSQVGVTYEIMANGVGSGITAAGTGAALNILAAAAGFTDGDVITVEATNGGICPAATMTGNFTLSIDASPNVGLTVTASANTICEGDAVTISVVNGENGVSYQLRDLTNAVDVGAPQVGDGASTLDFASGVINSTTEFGIVASNGTCAPVQLTQTQTITTDAPPSTALTVTASSNNICDGDAVTISVQGSEVGVSYQLRDLTNAADIGAPQVGTGAALDFASGAISGTTEFAVVATNGTCPPAQLAQTQIITTNTIATQNVTTTDLSVCDVDNFTVDLAGSEVGITYELLANGVATGITEAGTGAALQITTASAGFTSGDVITVEASNGGICPPVVMTGSFTLTIDPTPDNSLAVTASANTVCEGDAATVSVALSEVGITYQLRDITNAVDVGAAQGGTGATLDFGTGAISATTEFAIVATSGTCTPVQLTQTQTITTDTPPNTALVVTASTNTICQGDSVLISVAASENGVSYQLRNITDGIDIGSPQVGDGSTLDFNTSAIATTAEFAIVATNGVCPSAQLTTTQTITVNPVVAPGLGSDDADNIICEGQSVTFTASPAGQTQYEFFINGVSAVVQASEIWVVDTLKDGDSVSVTVTNGTGCTADAGLSPVSVPAIVLGITSTDADTTICENDVVTISATGSGGTSFDFFLNGVIAQSGVSTDFTLGTLNDTDEVYVVATGAGGCTVTSDTLIWNVNAPTPATISSSDADDLICAGEMVVFTAGPAGMANYEFFLNGASIQNSAVDTLAIDTLDDGDAVNVVITDLNGCTSTSVDIITNVLPGVSLSANVTDATCNGDTDGAIDITVTGSPAPYTILWSDGNTTDLDRTGLPAGNYGVSVEDASGCRDTIAVVINEPAPLVITVDSTTDVTCNGDSTGAIFITVSGGNGGYTFDWGAGISTEDLENMPAGSYTVTVTDGLGCIASSPVLDINEPTALAVSVSTTDPSACGATDGSIDLTVSGGTGPYTFAWSNLATTEDISGLGAGTYFVTITDNNTCDTTITGISLAEPGGIASLGFTPTDVLCNGDSSGSIALTVNGGTGPFSFFWYNADTSISATTQDLLNVPAGNYFVTVTDANNCTYTDGASIAQPSSLNLSAIVSDLSSCGSADGAIDLTVSGGAGGYSFDWSNLETTEDVGSLTSGIYSVIVTDANGCQDSVTNIIVSEPSGIVVTDTTIVDATCFGGSDGSIDITVTGGTAPLTFSWNGGAFTTEDISGLSAGTYNLTITDDVTCSTILSVVVGEPAQIDATEVITDATCGNADGAIDITPTGGDGAYSYFWYNADTSFSDTNEDVSGLLADTYNVTITDGAGCERTLSYVVNDLGGLPAAVSSISVTNQLCDSVVFAWPATAEPSYVVDVAEDANFTTLVVSDSVVTDTMFGIGIADGLTWFARVRVRNSCGDSDFSDTLAIQSLPVPAAPINLNATGLSCGGATTQWDAVTGATGYLVDYGTDSTFGSTIASDVAATANFLDISGLSTSTDYVFRVRAISACGDTTAFSGLFGFATTSTSASPTTIADTAPECDKFVAMWSTIGGVTDYTVEVATDAAFTNVIDSVLVTGTSYLVTGLTSDTDYFFRVYSEDPVCGQSAPSANQLVTTSNGLVAPANVNVINTSCNGITVGWDAVAGAESYRVQLDSSTAFATILDEVTVSTLNTAFGGLEQDSTYFFRVAAIDSCGNVGAFISNFGSTTNAAAAAPTITASAVGCDELTLDWTAVPGATYTLQVSDDAGFANLLVDNSGIGNANTTFVVSGLTSGTDYFFRVRGDDPVCDSTAFGTGSATTDVSLAAPTSLTQTGSDCSTITVSWSAVSGATGYLVTFQNSAGGAAQTLTVGGATTATTISGLTFGNTYDVTVATINDCGTSAPSTVLSASTSADASCDFDCTRFRITVFTEATSCGGVNDGIIGILVGSQGRLDNEWAVIPRGSTDTTWVQFEDPSLAEATGLAAGTYTVLARHVDAGTGIVCMAPARTAIVSSNSTSFTAPATVVKQPSCSGTGEIAINPSGGTGPYTLVISDGGSMQDTLQVTGIVNFDSLSAGIYSYTVADTIANPNGCTVAGSVVLTGQPQLVATYTLMDSADCSGENEGIVLINASGGSGTYQYSTDGTFRDGGLFNPLRDSLPSGLLTLYVRDVVDTSCIVPVFPFVPTGASIIQLGVFETVESATCDNNDGVVKVPPMTGGAQPYTYEVDGVVFNMPADSLITGLGRGAHQFSVVDLNGCRQVFQFAVTAPRLVLFEVESVDASCEGDGSDGALRVEITQGEAPFFYALSLDEEFTQVSTNPFFIDGLAPGRYEIYIRSGDAESTCPNVQEATVLGFENVSFDFNSLDKSCSYEDDGVIELTNIRGGIGNDDSLRLFLNGVELESNLLNREYLIRNLPADFYEVELVREGVCPSVATEQIAIASPDPFAIANDTDGQIIVEPHSPGRMPFQGKILVRKVVGGTPPYTVDVLGTDVSVRREDIPVNQSGNNGGFNVDILELPSGDYTLNFYDANGCTFTEFPNVPEDTTVFIPNAFTPNGDGINDRFFIGNLSKLTNGTTALDYELVIMNRWGDVVKVIENYDNNTNAWDGTGKDGAASVPNGVYFYSLQPMQTDFQTPDRVYRGTVEVLREF